MRIFLTGASSGIGRALALAWAKRGASIALVARREAELRALAEEVKRLGGSAEVYVLDVADPNSIKDGLRASESQFGALDMIVANAGVGLGEHETVLRWESVERQIDVNFRGTLATLIHGLDLMRPRGHGHLVGVTSIAGRRGLPGGGAYSASKAGLSVFLETLRLDVRKFGIRVTDIQPGFVATEMTAAIKHPMPLLWSADKAAEYIVKKLVKAPRILAFPPVLDRSSRALALMPDILYDPFAKMVLDQHK